MSSQGLIEHVWQILGVVARPDESTVGAVHHQRAIEVESDSANFSMTIENLPSAENPRTGRITALSVIATLRGLVAPLRVGA